MVSQKDIAEALDVSVSLVSKVLNDRLGNTGVRDELAQAIREKANELGYRPNASALAFRRGRHDVVGVFVHAPGMAGSGIIEDLLAGVTSAAREAGQRQTISFYRSSEDFRQLCENAHPGTMDGLLVAGIIHKEILPTLKEVQESGLPVVTLFDEPIDESFPNVGMDQQLTARVATEHLIERGCSRIAHIVNTAPRFEGYKVALEVGGLPFLPQLVYEAKGTGGYTHTVGEKAVRALLEAGQRIDGFMAQADQEAMGVMNELARQGLGVPEDVRVAGIDNAPYCEFARVPLTSVSQRFDERGARAVQMLLRLVEGQDVESMVLEPILHVRASSA